ncbi:hypothetical protein ACQCN2_04580 [Brevibacillus ginsengisoli]|uniref:hypothetical protein n=1 Tax=Brevibacillus ginsengisoli TaxID=363854 RepID=UPI003CFA99E7
MEDRKHFMNSHWITPDVFSGEIQHAVGQSNYVKRVMEFEQQEVTIEESDVKWNELIETIADLKNRVVQLEESVTQQQEKMDDLKKYIRELEENQTKERAHLYQVVLLLKQEWETLK